MVLANGVRLVDVVDNRLLTPADYATRSASPRTTTRGACATSAPHTHSTDAVVALDDRLGDERKEPLPAQLDPELLWQG